jgi:hypothetical protein
MASAALAHPVRHKDRQVLVTDFSLLCALGVFAAKVLSVD